MADQSTPQTTSNGSPTTTTTSSSQPPSQPRGVKSYNLNSQTTNDTHVPPFSPVSQTSTSDEARGDSEDVTSPSSIASPPYWMQSHSRSISNVSVESMMGGITLLDNTDEGGVDAKTGGNGSSACWAKHVYIEDHTVINGSRTGIGAFVVWNVTVETLYGSPIRLRKRYSEFDELKEKLLQTFPRSTLPELPRKSLTAKFRPKFLEERREGLQYFLNSVLLNPEFSGSPVLKEFVFD